MFWNAKSGSVNLSDTTMDYVTFGTGTQVLVMIPGLGDGLTTLKGMAAAMAYTYRIYAKVYKVYVFSRKNNLEMYQDLNQTYTTREMADDLAFALNALGIGSAKVLGVSQGGIGEFTCAVSRNRPPVTCGQACAGCHAIAPKCNSTECAFRLA